MAISIDGLSSQYQQYLNQASVSEVEKRLGSDLTSASEEELMDACKEFETYFIEQIYKGMQKTILRNEDDSSATSSMKDYYEEKLMQQYAEMSTEQGGIGLAQQLFEQMKRNYNL